MVVYEIKNGKFTGNQLEIDDSLPLTVNYSNSLPPSETALWTGVVWSEPIPFNVPPIVIPQSITPRQARLKLLEVGLLDELEAIIVTNRSWQIEWEYATEVKRDSPLIDAVASQAGLTNEQVDTMFLEASQL